MTTITGGTISVEDGKKANEEFAPARKVRVELNFDIPQGANDHDAQVGAVGVLASSHVAKLLGTVAAVAVIKPVASGPTKADLANAAGVGEAAVAAATVAPKKAGARKPAPPVAATTTPAADPAAVVEEAEEDFSVPAEELAKEISDKELHEACGRKNSELKNPVLVREVIARFKPAGHQGAFQVIQIPQASRAKFLAELAAVKAA
jgi:hypothetical protein